MIIKGHNIVKEVKARLVKIIIPDAIVITTAMFSILGIFINICTTLFFGIGENFTSLKLLIIFIILAIVSLKLELGKKATVSIDLLSISEDNTTKVVFTIDINNKNATKDYYISQSNIKCIYELKSKDITLYFNTIQYDKKEKLKVFISGKDIGNPSELLNTLKEYNVEIKTVSEEAITS